MTLAWTICSIQFSSNSSWKSPIFRTHQPPLFYFVSSKEVLDWRLEEENKRVLMVCGKNIPLGKDFEIWIFQLKVHSNFDYMLIVIKSIVVCTNSKWNWVHVRCFNKLHIVSKWKILSHGYIESKDSQFLMLCTLWCLRVNIQL